MRSCAAVLVVVVAAVAVRSWTAGDVLGAERVRLIGGGDAEYHVLRAQHMAADWPRPLWVDPYLDYPHGALIPWPPLLDQIVATAAVVTGSGADAEHVARVAAIFPVIFAAVTALLLVPLARALAGGSGIAAAFIASMLPASVGYGFVGLADQHALELLLWCSALLAYALGSRTRRLAPAAGLGLALALSFWNWPGSAAYLVLLSAHAALAHVVEPGGPGSARAYQRTLAIGAGIAAVLLTVSVALLAPAGALQRMAIVSIGGLSVALCAAVAVGSGALLVAHAARRGRPAGPPRRIAEAAAAGALAGAALLAVPGVLDGIRYGLVAAGAANAWYRSIAEFWPMVGSTIRPLRRELLQPLAFFGLALPALPLAAMALRREWAERPERRGDLFLVAVWCAASLVAALARMRFMLYLSVPLGVCCAAWLDRSARRSGRWRTVVVAGGALAIVAPAYLLFDKPTPSDARLVEAIRWIASSQARGPQASAVMAPWTDGHTVRAAGLPIVASPFGDGVGVRSLRDEAAFFCGAGSGDEARAIARTRRIGFVVVRDPIDVVWSLQDLRPEEGLPPLVHETRSVWDGASLDPAADFTRTVMARLFYGDGMAPRRHGEPALGWARLLREELPPEPSGAPDRRQIKTYGIVPGALLRIRGAPPGAPLFMSARVSTNAGRTFTWATHGVADGAGEAALRVPYASGENGLCRALPYAVGDGARGATVTVSEEQVASGAEITVEL